MKQRVTFILRKLKLLALAENFFFVLSFLKDRKDNKKFLKDNPTFTKLPALLAYDAYGHTHLRTYDTSGLVHASFFADAILKHSKNDSLQVLDWGCGPARLIRHMPKLLNERSPKIYGCDYNPKTIDWCASSFKNIQFEKNGLKPPLPFPSSSFDAIYGLSVLTHLSEAMHFEWLQELRRILKPDGILILTTHGDAYLHKLLPHEQAVYEAQKLVIRDGIKEGSRCYTAFHPKKFMKETLLKDWNILEHLENPISHHISQDIWIAKKRP